jgi:hypothetical protein
MIPGDLGDARFNNFVLEHGYKFFRGEVKSFWNAGFMYPYPNVIALSDNLLGTLPLYSLFRVFLDRETSFQLWILALYALNYLCCFWALKKWSNNTLLSAIGAYVYAFSIFNIAQLHHVQVLPRFIVPLVIFWCWKYFSEKDVKYFLYTILGISFQFYCGVYMGFMLVYVLLFFGIAYLIIYKDFQLLKQFKLTRNILQHLAIFILAALLLLPLMLPYIEVSKVMGMRKFENALSTIPQLRSYFFTFPGSKTWSPLLYNHSAYGFTDWWNHFLFIGAIPWLAVLITPFVFFSKKIDFSRKKFLGFIVLSLFLCFIFCLNIGGFTLYRLIFVLPGFSSMRSIDRIINTEIILFVLLLVFVLKELSENYKTFKLICFMLPVLIILDNLIEPLEIKKFSKSDSQSKISAVRLNIKNQYDKAYSAVLYAPIETYVSDPEAAYYKNVELQVTTMLAAQELNIPCVNGYTGFYPGNYESLFYSPDDQQLQGWCEFSKGDIKKVQRINEIGKKEKGRKFIHLKAYNHKFVSAIEGKTPFVFADKDKADSWETFLLVLFEDGLCALKANTNLFFSAQLDGNGEITASRPKVASWETFLLAKLDNNSISFKAINGTFLSLDSISLQLYARDTAITEQSKYLIIYK